MARELVDDPGLALAITGLASPGGLQWLAMTVGGQLTTRGLVLKASVHGRGSLQGDGRRTRGPGGGLAAGGASSVDVGRHFQLLGRYTP